jgi:FKBP-type peptidyl-prolyl cis-trans isomerase FkpA
MKSINLTICILAMVVFIGCGGLPDRGADETIVTDGGFEMVLHEQGDGPSANPGEYVYFTRVVTIRDSVVFDSRTRPETPYILMPEPDNEEAMENPEVNAFRLMGVGDSATVRQVPDQMLVDRFNMEEGETVDWNVKILEIIDAETYNERRMEEQMKIRREMEALQERQEEVGEFARGVLSDYKAGNLGNAIIETESGLKYVIHEEGTGDQFERGDVASVHYYGLLVEDESMFDNSFRAGSTFDLNVGMGMVIQGWDEALLKFREGTIATLFIPHHLAYGEAGSPPVIPERAELLFYIEVQD